MNKLPDDHHEEEHLGHVISRRKALKLFASSPFILALAGCSKGHSTPMDTEKPLSDSCVVRPELTEGPFYIDTNKIRSDIKENREGVLLELDFSVQKVSGSTCLPLTDALVDVWHADANGNYSGVENLQNEQFLRGIQSTDQEGHASFATIFPGWYRGRPPHIHFKVRSPKTADSAYEFTSQLFFQTELSKQIYRQAPYSDRGVMDTLNSNDFIYQRGGDDLMLNVQSSEQGYRATFAIALYLE